MTHKPKAESIMAPGVQSSNGFSNLSHTAQWESARLEAESRLGRESKLRARGLWFAQLRNVNASSDLFSRLQRASPGFESDREESKIPGLSSVLGFDCMKMTQKWDKFQYSRSGTKLDQCNLSALGGSLGVIVHWRMRNELVRRAIWAFCNKLCAMLEYFIFYVSLDLNVCEISTLFELLDFIETI